MSVLLEAFSVVIRSGSIAQKYEGGVAQFIQDVPNLTGCGDGELVRVGFMNWLDLAGYIDLLKLRGLTHPDSKGQSVDAVAIDSRSGPREPCDWLQFGNAQVQRKGATEPEKTPIIWARLKGGQAEQVVLPQGWHGPGKVQFVDPAAVSQRMRFVRREGDLDVLADVETGKEVYVGRTGTQRPSGSVDPAQ